MPLSLNHKNLEVYKFADMLVLEAYDLTRNFTYKEDYTLGNQIRRAAISVKLNIAEGASRKTSRERRRFFEISRSSVVETECALETAIKLKIITQESTGNIYYYLEMCFKLLSGLLSIHK